MKLKYLGTAAAEGIPALFCRCEMCAYARKAGGKEIRRRAGALLDGTLKLDFGPDSYWQMISENLDYTDIHAALITHSHEDHLEPCDVTYRRPGFANKLDGDRPMTVYGNGKVMQVLEKYSVGPWQNKKQLQAFETVEIEGYQVTPLEAVHCLSWEPDARWPVVFENRAYLRKEEAFIYLIEKDGKKLLYAHDTDELTPADMDYLAGKKIDLISLDCTNGLIQAEYIGHMGAADNLRMREKLLACGAADAHTIFVANHFSHNGAAPMAEMQKRLPGFIVAYDGMEIEF